MARQRISEYRAKQLLFTAMGLPYAGVPLDATMEIPPQLMALHPSQQYVIKVDQGVKKRMKRGLIILNKSVAEIPSAAAVLREKGFTRLLVEPMQSYAKEYERYFALQRERNGYELFYSQNGGVDIEEHENSVKTWTLPYSGDRSEGKKAIEDALELPGEKLEKILHAFDTYFFSFLEINPLITHGEAMHIIDLAVEVDSTAEFFVNGAWSSDDFTYGEEHRKTEEEKAVEALKQKSQAAFSLNVLNPHGSIFMLLSGGGASLVLADEVANVGLGQELANYGEYSGNPNQEETYLYTTQILALLLRSQAQKKVLIIGGGVANFTDVRITFRGVIRALEEKKDELLKQNVQIFVRRGGPNQAEGLVMMREFLMREKLYGNVVGPDVVLTEIIHDAIKTI